MRKIKVKFTCFWTDDSSLYKYVKMLGGGSSFWKNIEFTKSQNFDFLVVLTRPYNYNILEGINSKSVLLFLTEPIYSLNIDHDLIKEYSKSKLEYLFLPTWGEITNLQFDKIWRKGVKIRKDKLLSTVCSELIINDDQNFPGYLDRLTFLRNFDKWTDDSLDWFGRKYSGKVFNSVSCYKGEIKNKYDALFPYKYHFNCENSYVTDYFTEKLVDPILAECLCFYYGCPNISELIDPNSYVLLDLSDPERSFWIIKNTIDKNLYHKNIGAIKNTKLKLLNELNPVNKVYEKIRQM